MPEFLKETVQFSCPGRERDYSREGPLPEILEKEWSGEILYEAAAYISRRKGTRRLQLPPVLTAEAEAFGLTVKHDRMGRRIREESLLPLAALKTAAFPDEQHPLWGAVLDSVRIAASSGDGWIIQFGVSGAFSLAMALLGTKAVFRAAVVDREGLHDLLGRLNAWIYSNIRHAFAAGASLIFYADASGDQFSLGERHYREFVLTYEIELLEQLKGLDKLVFVCGKTSAALIRYGFFRAGGKLCRGMEEVELVMKETEGTGTCFAGLGCLMQEQPMYGYWLFPVEEQ